MAIDPFSIIGAGLSAGGSLLGGLIGASENKHARDLQEEMFGASMKVNRQQYGTSMRESKRQYNQSFAESQRQFDTSAALAREFAGDSRAYNDRVMAANLAEAHRAEALQYAREDSRIQRVMKDAMAAGVHPLAALGSQAVGGFASPVTAQGGGVSGGNAPQGGGVPGGTSIPGPPGLPGIPSIPGQSGLGDAVGNAFAILGQALAARGQVLDQEATKAVIRKTDVESALALGTARSRSVISGARAGSLGGRNSMGSDNPLAVRVPGVESGLPWLNVPGWIESASDVQERIENDYGDVVGEGFGIWRVVNDAVDNAVRLATAAGEAARRDMNKQIQTSPVYRQRDPIFNENFWQ